MFLRSTRSPTLKLKTFTPAVRRLAYSAFCCSCAAWTFALTWNSILAELPSYACGRGNPSVAVRSNAQFKLDPGKTDEKEEPILQSILSNYALCMNRFHALIETWLNIY